MKIRTILMIGFLLLAIAAAIGIHRIIADEQSVSIQKMNETTSLRTNVRIDILNLVGDVPLTMVGIEDSGMYGEGGVAVFDPPLPRSHTSKLETPTYIIGQDIQTKSSYLEMVYGIKGQLTGKVLSVKGTRNGYVYTVAFKDNGQIDLNESWLEVKTNQK